MKLNKFYDFFPETLKSPFTHTDTMFTTLEALRTSPTVTTTGRLLISSTRTASSSS